MQLTCNMMKKFRCAPFVKSMCVVLNTPLSHAHISEKNLQKTISFHIINEFLQRRNHRSITNFSSMLYYKMTGKQKKRKKERMIHRQGNAESCID